MENDQKDETSDGCLWKRPSDVMRKIKMRRKRVVSNRSMSTSVAFPAQKEVSGNKKRISNPFAKKRSNSEAASDGKKRILSTNEISSFPELPLWEKDENCQSVFDVAGKMDSKEVLDNNDLGFVFLNEDSIQNMFSPDCFPKLPAPPTKVEKHSTIPADWSLKTKARFLSSSTFAWCARIRGNEEAKSIVAATRCHSIQATDPTQSDFRVELCKCLVYHQHPSIPWFKLFPRFGTECRVAHGASCEPLGTEHAISCIYDSWVAAFRSAYQMLRENLCPYFYVCAQQYTAVFRAAVVSSSAEINCLITPTSMGFRSSLKSEGIEFTMPLQQPKNITSDPANSLGEQQNKVYSKENCPDPEQDTNKKEGCEDTKGETPDDLESEQEEQQWKDISDGLQFRQNKEVTTAVQNDGQPRTAVLIQGLTNTQILFNYLLNCRSSITNSGSQAGIPPTILSPTPFLGSSLKKLDFKAGIAKMRDEDCTDMDRLAVKNSTKVHQKFSLDISGPLLPHHVSGVVSLLNKTQENANFTCAFRTHLYTAPFNAPCQSNKEIEKPNNSDVDNCGLSNSCVARLTNPDPLTVRQIKSENSNYTWQVL